MRINQVGKIDFQLFDGQLIRATIKVTGDPPNGTRIAIDSLVALSLKLQRSEVTSV
jgi:hypothetical protein